MNESVLRMGNFLGAAIVAGVLFFPQNTDRNLGPRKHLPHVSIGKPTPLPEDVSTIDGIIKAYYEVVSGPAEQPRQWGRDSTLYMYNVRFVVIQEDATGAATARSMSHQEFIDESDASLSGKAFYEHEVHRITHRAGNVVQVLSTAEHTTAPDGPVAGRSVDSLELFWDGKRWWIAGVTIWDINSTKHLLPPEFLP